MPYCLVVEEVSFMGWEVEKPGHHERSGKFNAGRILDLTIYNSNLSVKEINS
jgi:hypothetical protein